MSRPKRAKLIPIEDGHRIHAAKLVAAHAELWKNFGDESDWFDTRGEMVVLRASDGSPKAFMSNEAYRALQKQAKR